MSLNLEAILELLKQHVSPAAQRVPKGWEIIAREAHRQGVIDGRAIQMEKSGGPYLAAGASEGQAEPVAWMTEGKYPSPRFIIGNTDPSGVWKEQYVPLYLRPSAELTALRERIAGMEKDAARWRIAREFEYVTDFEVLGIDQRIDAGFAKEKHV